MANSDTRWSVHLCHPSVAVISCKCTRQDR
jgi:hypothetical protein